MVAAHRLLRGQRAFECALLAVVLDRNRFLRSARQTGRVGHCQRNGDAVVAALRVVVIRVRARRGARRTIAEAPLPARHS